MLRRWRAAQVKRQEGYTAGTCNRLPIAQQKTVAVDRISVLPLHLFT
jgi:hypothetical protein